MAFFTLNLIKCNVRLKAVVPVFVGTLIIVVLMSVLIYRCRVNVFIKFNLHPFNVDECDNEDMSFDAFVCCAGPDDEVASTVVRCLEHSEPGRTGYRVCYHARDFPLGGVITASIEWAIQHSKRVICLMSNDFIRSEMCMLEFLSAWHWNIKRHKHRLIVIKWPDLDLSSDPDPGSVNGLSDLNNVRLYLSTYTYYEYGSATWWQQVLYAMPINRMGSRCLEDRTLCSQEHRLDNNPLVDI